MNAGRRGLTGAASALLITLVLVAGIASASYVNMTTIRYNEAQMQEALRQARLGSELIRIHIHSADGSVDSPPMVTFVNAWGFESRVRQLVLIARNMSVLATVNLTQPIVLPPGSRLTISPSQIGLGYRTFRELADNVRSIHAYTEAGNSFGSTWGFPREDNMAGRTVAVTYNTTTTEVWNVPSFTTRNSTYTRFYYTTIGEIPPVSNATLRAVHRFQKIALYVPGTQVRLSSFEWNWGASQDRFRAFPPGPSDDTIGAFNPVLSREAGMRSLSYDSTCGCYVPAWWWQSINEYVELEGPPVTVEANIRHILLNLPSKYILSVQYVSYLCNNPYGGSCGWAQHTFTITYSVSIATPLVQYMFVRPNDNIVVYRNYHPVDVQYQVYYPPSSPPSYGGVSSSGGGPGPITFTEHLCNVVGSSSQQGDTVVLQVQVVGC